MVEGDGGGAARLGCETAGGGEETDDDCWVARGGEMTTSNSRERDGVAGARFGEAGTAGRGGETVVCEAIVVGRGLARESSVLEFAAIGTDVCRAREELCWSVGGGGTGGCAMAASRCLLGW